MLLRAQHCKELPQPEESAPSPPLVKAAMGARERGNKLATFYLTFFLGPFSIGSCEVASPVETKGVRKDRPGRQSPVPPQLAPHTFPIPCVSKALGQLRGLQAPPAHLTEENEVLLFQLRLLGGVQSLESSGLHLQGTFQLRHWEESRG